MSWIGANNISSGITIDLGQMDKTTYNPGTEIASLQPGGSWADVYTVLEKGTSYFASPCFKMSWLTRK